MLLVKRIIIASILLPFMVLLALALFRQPLHAHKIEENKSADMLYSVSVAQKGLALAIKSDQAYQIAYESAPTQFSICDLVTTTGLEKYSEPDITLGYISSIDPSAKSRYLEIHISPENPCTRS